jgi:hypothetical protein
MVLPFQSIPKKGEGVFTLSSAHIADFSWIIYKMGTTVKTIDLNLKPS